MEDRCANIGENINIARMMTAENIFPQERELYDESEPPTSDDPYIDRSTKPTILRKVVWWMQALIILFSISIISIKGLDWANTLHWPIIVVGTIALSIIGELVYLMTYNIKFEFSYKSGQIKICFAIQTQYTVKIHSMFLCFLYL